MEIDSPFFYILFYNSIKLRDLIKDKQMREYYEFCCKGILIYLCSKERKGRC